MGAGGPAGQEEVDDQEGGQRAVAKLQMGVSRTMNYLSRVEACFQPGSWLTYYKCCMGVVSELCTF